MSREPGFFKREPEPKAGEKGAGPLTLVLTKLFTLIPMTQDEDNQFA